MRETGFRLHEVIHSATIMGAEAPVMEDNTGSLQASEKVDLVLVREHPIAHLTVCYGTDWIRLNHDTRKVGGVGGMDDTIKVGIVFNARELLADVRRTVEAQKAKLGMPASPMPTTIEAVDTLTPDGTWQ